jgi:hypothetical protein
MTDRSNCVDCTKTVVKSQWDKCLNNDLSGNKLCRQKANIPANSVIQPHPPHHSHKFRQAQIVKNPGRTVYGRWSRAKWNKQTKQYTMLNGSGRSICEKGLS